MSKIHQWTSVVVIVIMLISSALVLVPTAAQQPTSSPPSSANLQVSPTGTAVRTGAQPTPTLDPWSNTQEHFQGSGPELELPLQPETSEDIMRRYKERYDRLTYPNGYIPPRAIERAAAWSKANIPDALPSGSESRPGQRGSPAGLQYDRWTALGPQPTDAGNNSSPSDFQYGRSSGRINMISPVPGSTSTVLIGTAGGGVWRVSGLPNNPSWTPLGDNDPVISSSVIGAVAIDPSNTSTIYVGTGDPRTPYTAMTSRGMYKSTDNGQTWSIIGADPDPGTGFPGFVGVSEDKPYGQKISAIRIDPGNTSTLIVGTNTNELNYLGGSAWSGVYFSHNSGGTWYPCPIDAPPAANRRQMVTDMFIDTSVTPHEVFVALGYEEGSSANGIYKASIPQAGCPASWQTVLDAYMPPLDSYIPPGATDPYELGIIHRIQIAQSPSDPNVIYAVMGGENDAVLGVVRSVDRGATWTLQADASAFLNCASNTPAQTASQVFYNMYVAVSPTVTNTIYIGLVDIFKSTDGGQTIDNLTGVYEHYNGANPCPRYGEVHPDQHDMEILSNGTILAANDGGLYVSTNNAARFDQVNDGLSTLQFYAGDLSPNFAYDPEAKAFGGLQDNGTVKYDLTSNTPQVWQMTYGGDGGYAAIEPKQGNNWYAEYVYAAIKCSTQQGNITTFVNCAPPWTNNEQRAFIAPFVLDHYHCGDICERLVTGGNTIWQSLDSAATWQRISPNITSNNGQSAPIRSIALARATEKLILAGADNGAIALGTEINFNWTWRQIMAAGTNGVAPPSRSVAALAFTPDSAEDGPITAYAAFDGFSPPVNNTTGHIYRLDCPAPAPNTAACATYTWTDITGILPNVPHYAVAVNPRNPKQVFVGNEIGFYFTEDATAADVHWARFQTGMPSVPIYNLSTDVGDTTLAAWTHGRGMYAIRLPELKWSEVCSSTPSCPIAGGTKDSLASIDMRTSRDGWIVGSRTLSTTQTESLVMQWDGSSWTEGQSINPYDWQAFADVSILHHDQVWAVGSFKDVNNNNDEVLRNFVARWNGQQWQVAPNIPNDDSQGNGDKEINYLTGVLAQPADFTLNPPIADDQIWVVGRAGTPERPTSWVYEAGNWTNVPVFLLNGNNAAFSGITAMDRTNVWGVGYITDNPLCPHPLILSLDVQQKAWVEEWSDLNTCGYLSGVSVEGGKVSGWAVGTDISNPNARRPLLVRMEPTQPGAVPQWSAVAAPATGGQHSTLLDIKTLSPSEAWAVGNTYDGSLAKPYRSLLMRWRDTQANPGWQVISPPFAGASYLNAVAGSGDLWSVGHNVCDNRPLIIHGISSGFGQLSGWTASNDPDCPDPTPTITPTATIQPTATPQPPVAPPPAACNASSTVVADDRYRLDFPQGCQGNINADLQIARYYGPVDATGRPSPDMLGRTIDLDMKLKMRIRNVPGNINFTFNGSNYTLNASQYVNYWETRIISIQYDDLILPQAPGTNGQPPAPASNIINIPLAGNAEIDWIQLDVPGMRPTALVAGFNSNRQITSPESSATYFQWTFNPAEEALIERPLRYGHASIVQGGALLRDELEQKMVEYGVQRINLIGHSMGGLWSREYAWLERSRSAARTRIDNLLMVGTPNDGSILANTLVYSANHCTPISCPIWRPWVQDLSPAVLDLTTSSMRQYNASHPAVDGVCYADEAGTTNGAPHDGAVGVGSVRALPYSYHWPTVNKSIQNGSVHGQMVTDDDFIDPLRGIYQYLGGHYYTYTQQPCQVTAPPVIPRPARPELAYSLYLPYVAQPAGPQTGQLPTTADLIQPGQRRSFQLPLDQLQSADFFLTWFSPTLALSLTLVAPNGTTITPATLPSNVTFAPIEFGTSYHLSAPAAGWWTVHVDAPASNTAAVPFIVSGEVFGGVALDVQTSRAVVAPNQPVTITATLSDRGTPTASVSATISTLDSAAISTLALSNLGNGRYQLVYTPTQSGDYIISLTASGSSAAGRPFARQDLAQLSVSDAARISAPATAQPFGSSNQNLRLDVAVPVQISAPGQYRLDAQLTSASGRLITGASQEATLAAGTQSITLAFDGESIGRTLLDGPYQVRTLRLYHIDASGRASLADQQELALTTADYDRYGWYRPGILQTGALTSTGVSTTTGGLYTALRLSLPVDVATAQFYNGSANLYGPAGQVIATARMDFQALEQGTNTVTFVVNGSAIRAAGIDGPYTLDDVVLWAEPLPFIAAQMVDVEVRTDPQSYSASEFGPLLRAQPLATPTAGPVRATPTATATYTLAPTPTIKR